MSQTVNVLYKKVRNELNANAFEVNHLEKHLDNVLMYLITTYTNRYTVHELKNVFLNWQRLKTVY